MNNTKFVNIAIGTLVFRLYKVERNLFFLNKINVVIGKCIELHFILGFNKKGSTPYTVFLLWLLSNNENIDKLNYWTRKGKPKTGYMPNEYSRVFFHSSVSICVCISCCFNIIYALTNQIINWSLNVFTSQLNKHIHY